MANYPLNPPLPLEIARAEIQSFILDLVTAKMNIEAVRSAIPIAPGEMKIHQRLNTAIVKIQTTIELLRESLL